MEPTLWTGAKLLPEDLSDSRKQHQHNIKSSARLLELLISDHGQDRPHEWCKTKPRHANRLSVWTFN